MSEIGKNDEMITVKDQAGDLVVVPRQIQRIVVIGALPLPAVLTVFFNSADKIVGMPKASMIAAQKGLLGELYPKILKTDTSFDENGVINIAKVQQLKPDVVFYNADHTQQKADLLAAGLIPVGISSSNWHYDAIQTLDEQIGLLSKMFPENAKSKIVNDYSLQAYDLVQKRVEAVLPAQRQKIFFLFRYDAETLDTSGSMFFGQYWADAIGAVNVGHALKHDNATTVDMAQINRWNPAKILITNFTSAEPDDLYHNTIGAYDWQQVAAVQNHQVYKMPLGSYRSYTPGVDTPLTLLWLAKTVYPDLFQDIDMTTETKNYYQKVFQINLTTAQVQKMFHPTAAASAY